MFTAVIAKVKVWDDGVNDGFTNMSRDAELIEPAIAGQGACRVYEWDGPWVSLGRSQVPELSLKSNCQVPFVMRPTGGKAVLHGHDLTVGIAMPVSIDPREVKAIYRGIVPILVGALNRVGIPAALAEETPFVRGAGKVADCFAHVSANDIVDPTNGTKVCGCALRVVSGAVLVQASIPVGIPAINPADVFNDPALPNRKFAATRAELTEAVKIELAKFA